MNIEEIKQQIENATIIDSPLIFKYSDSSFVPMQYVEAIAKIKNKEIVLLDTFEPTNTFFNPYVDKIRVIIIDSLDYEISLQTELNIIFITKSIDKKVKKVYNDIIIEFPKLEQWQIKDYVFSNCLNVEPVLLENLCINCEYDLYRLSNEISKVSLFDTVTEQTWIIKNILAKSKLGHLSNTTVYTIVDAIIKRDLKQLSELLYELGNCQIDSVGLLQLLINAFRNVILVQLAKAPTAEGCGMSSKQFWVVKNYNCNYYTREQLIKIYTFLTGLDKEIKTGNMPTEYLLDYMLVKILGA